ncbi:MAG: hypothetical protein AAF515_11490 [Pseudomonadota bacterium]
MIRSPRDYSCLSRTLRAALTGGAIALIGACTEAPSSASSGTPTESTAARDSAELGGGRDLFVAGGSAVSTPGHQVSQPPESLAATPGTPEGRGIGPGQPPSWRDGAGGSFGGNAPQAPPTQSGPSVTLALQPGTDPNAMPTKLVWTAANARSCRASGAWGGNRPLRGDEDLLHTAPGQHTYRLTCDGVASGAAMATVTVYVQSAPVHWQAPQRNDNGTTLTDLAGYNLYYGTSPGTYTHSLPVRDPSATSAALPVLPGTYYLALTAYDHDGNESDYSNEIVRHVR